MKFHLNYSVIAFLAIFITTGVWSQNNGLYVPVNLQKAYSKETRSFDGMPGKNYWQNEANYKMDVQFDPLTRLLKGEAVITYFNNSPDTLDKMVFHLFPNVYKTGQLRDFEIDPKDLGDGMMLKSFTIGGKIVDLSPQSEMLEYNQTLAYVNLSSPMDPIAPDTTVKINVTWEYTLNAGSAMRTGQVDSASFFIAYFFPRVAVYDDIDGWNDYLYTGTTEFYNDFGNYDVSISLPMGYVAWATGQLQNPAQCLTMKYLNRYLDALDTNILVKIIDQQDLLYRDFTSPDPEIIWNFKANHVSDFAFALSDHYLWDAVNLEVDKNTGRKTLINVAYDQHSDDFVKVLPIAKKAVTYMSETFPAISFPYPQVTVFNGLDEMEYPMMVNDMSLQNIQETFSLTAHEIFHNYFPFNTGNNERKYAWMDEGITSFFEYNIMRDIIDKDFKGIYQLDSYIDELGHDRDLPLITTSELIRSPQYFHLSYSKATMFYLALDNLIGHENFKKLLQEFTIRWQGKHPTGFDFLNTLLDVTEQDLMWLINPWFFEYGYIDYGISKITQNEGKAEITIIKKGKLPAPLQVIITFTDEEIVVKTLDVSVWKKGSESYLMKLDNLKEIKTVDLSFGLPMDANPDDNHFEVQ